MQPGSDNAMTARAHELAYTAGHTLYFEGLFKD